MTEFLKSQKLHGVCYDIRGPVLDHANRLEDEGHRILKLNIGNPAAFGFEAPDEIIQDVIRNLVADIPDGDLVLIIGYASETGNLDSNQTLSSARATAAARSSCSAVISPPGSRRRSMKKPFWSWW